MMRVLQIAGSIAAVLLGLCLLPWDKLVAGASRIDLVSFLIALALALASVATTGLRWIYIVRRLAPVPVMEHWRIYCLGAFFNSFTPANIGGDVYRVAALCPYATAYSISSLVAAVTVERILGLCSFLLGYLISLAAQAAIDMHTTAQLPRSLLYPAVPVAAALAAMAMLPLVRHLHYRLPLLSRHPRLLGQLRNFQRGAQLAITRNLGVLGILSVLAWVLWVATVAVVASQLDLGLPVTLLAMIVSVTEIIRLIPLSFQGIGIREGVFSALVGLAGSAPATGFVAAAVAYAALSLALAISGLSGGLLTLISPVRAVPGTNGARVSQT
jgi:uncharacterized protein (TIRG00374 family)